MISIALLIIGVIYNRQKRKKIIEISRRRNDILYINDPNNFNHDLSNNNNNNNTNNNNMSRYHNTQQLNQNFKLANSASLSSSSTTSGLTHSDCLIDDQKYIHNHHLHLNHNNHSKKENAKNQKTSPSNNLISLNSYDVLNNLDISIPSCSNNSNNNNNKNSNNTYNKLSHITIKTNSDYQIYDDPPPPYKLSKYYPVADRLVSDHDQNEQDQSHVYENIDDLVNSSRNNKRKSNSKQNRGKFRSLKKNASLNNLNNNNSRSNEHMRPDNIESSLLIDDNYNNDEQLVRPSAPNMENI